LSHSTAILPKLAQSKNLWEKRIAIIATYAFIREGKSAETFRIATLLMKDPHDLIRKAVGWMLREVGKHCSRQELEQFLKKHHHHMPRTMLRYAIEHFSPERRLAYLKK
jgi:3-methyladenine DNA glycosylase AlkD